MQAHQVITNLVTRELEAAITNIDWEKQWCGKESHIDQARQVLSDAYDRCDWYQRINRWGNLVRVEKGEEAHMVDAPDLNDHFMPG